MRQLAFELLDRREMLTAACDPVLEPVVVDVAPQVQPAEPGNKGNNGHKSTLELQTGWWEDDGTFTPFEVHTGQEFHVSGCGFELTSAAGGGGESVFSGDPRDFTYAYEADESGCITPGGSSTYTAPDKQGWYSITFYVFDDPSDPDSTASEGVFWFRVRR